MLERMVTTREGDEVVLRDKEEYLITASGVGVALELTGRLDLEYPSFFSPSGLFFVTSEGYFIIDPERDSIVSVISTADLMARRT